MTTEADAALAIETVEALDDATRAITEVLDLETVLQLIVDRVRELLDARYAALGMEDPQGRIERFITSGITAEERAAIGPPPRGHGLLALIIREGRSYRIPEISAHPDSYGFPPNHPPMHSLLGVPISVHGRAVGDLYLTDKQGASEFDATDQRVVELFARHAGVAIENTRLHDHLARLAVVEERDRIGRDLHDGIIQSLYAVGLSLEDVEALMADEPTEAAARVDAAIDAIHAAIGDIRHFILGLRPSLTGSRDLIGGLAAVVAASPLATTTDLEFDPSAAPAWIVLLDDAHTTELLHLAREALSNAARHAHADRVTVKLAGDDDEARLTIEDDGIGFDPDAEGDPGHQGLVNMRERAAAAGATLAVESARGSGTRIIVIVPNRPAVPEP